MNVIVEVPATSHDSDEVSEADRYEEIADFWDSRLMHSLYPDVQASVVQLLRNVSTALRSPTEQKASIVIRAGQLQAGGRTWIAVAQISDLQEYFDEVWPEGEGEAVDVFKGTRITYGPNGSQVSHAARAVDLLSAFERTTQHRCVTVGADL